MEESRRELRDPRQRRTAAPRRRGAPAAVVLARGTHHGRRPRHAGPWHEARDQLRRAHRRPASERAMATFPDYLTESPTERLPSGNPLELLPFRQRVIFMARAAHVPMTAIAGLLSISRETAYCELRARRLLFVLGLRVVRLLHRARLSDDLGEPPRQRLGFALCYTSNDHVGLVTDGTVVDHGEVLADERRDLQLADRVIGEAALEVFLSRGALEVGRHSVVIWVTAEGAW